MRKLARTLTLLSALPLGAVAAHADTLMDNFVATNTPFGTITATLPASPTPTSFTATSFEIPSGPVIVDGDTVMVNVDFFTLAAGGGAQGGGVRIDGPQLFSGPTSSPTFLLGTFPLGGFDLTISQAAAVPEPSSLALLGTGFLGICAVLRRKLISTRPNA